MDNDCSCVGTRVGSRVGTRGGSRGGCAALGDLSRASIHGGGAVGVGDDLKKLWVLEFIEIVFVMVLHRDGYLHALTQVRDGDDSAVLDTAADKAC